ncbi:MAG: cadherin repeat domain-containing protein [Planctomycetales bacterium]
MSRRHAGSNRGPLSALNFFRRKHQRRKTFWGGFGPEQVEQRILLTVSPFYKTMTIDGDFSDWSSIPGYTDPVNNTHDTDHDQASDTPAYVNHPDVDLIAYKAAYDDNNLYFYFKATGTIGRTQTASPGHAAGRYYVIVTMDVDDNDTTGYNLYEGGYYPSTNGYDMNSEIEFYDGTFNSGNYLNHGALNQTELNQAFLDQSQNQYVAGNDGPYPAGFVDIKPGTYKYYDEWVYHSDDTITFVRDKGPVVLGVIEEAISSDGHELEMIVPYVGFLKDSSGNPIVHLGSKLDLSFSLEASGELAPGGQWASNTAAPINGFSLDAPTYPPTDITLDNDTVPENEPNAVVGGLFTTDPDTTFPGDFTYQILPGGDGAEFELSGASLIVGPAGLDYEAGSTRTVNIRVTDADLNTFDKTFTINVTNVNEAAPVLNPTGDPSLASIPEDTFSSVGTSIKDLIASTSLGNNYITDADTADPKGLALYSAPSSGGNWQYSLDNGGTWTTISGVSQTNALLLAADAAGNTRLRFVPLTNFNGTRKVYFRAWDQSSGSNGGFADVTTNGGTTAFSVKADSATITVTPVNDAPLLFNIYNAVVPTVNKSSINNPGFKVSSMIASVSPNEYITDVDGGVEGIAIYAVQDIGGHWEYSLNNGTNWTSIGTVAANSALLLKSDASTYLRFVPNNTTIGDRKIFLRAWDQSVGTAGTKVDASLFGGTTPFSVGADSVTLTVDTTTHAPVLDPAGSPTLPAVLASDSNPAGISILDLIASGGLNYITDLESTDPQGIAVYGAPSSGGTWQYSLDSGATWTNVGTVDQSNSLLLRAVASTLIRFKPLATFAGTRQISFAAWDQSTGIEASKVDTNTRGGTTAFSSARDTATITVN